MSDAFTLFGSQQKPKPLVLIAGPCVIETRKLCFAIASVLKQVGRKHRIPVIFKASFDKANRTSFDSFRGPGLEAGLEILSQVKAKFGMPVLTDVHCISQVEPVAEVADIIQIPAFLCRQTDLLVAAAKTGRPVNIKKGQFMAPWDMENGVAKIRKAGNRKVLLTERGTLFGYNNLVVDMCGLPAMREFGVPVIFDATHAVQKPGAKGSASGGAPAMIRYLVRAAVAVGADGLFLEVHPNPAKALSDAATSLPLRELDALVREAMALDRITKSQR